MIIVDGSFGEGGGQILRTSASLSLILKKDIKIINIRKNRKPSGLKNQHKIMLDFYESVFNVRIEGKFVGSEEVRIYGSEFDPKSISLPYEWDLKTAASITLFLQGIIPVFMFYNIPVFFKIRGGTNVSYSPSTEYYEHILFPLLELFGFRMEIDVFRNGYYPKGGGEVYFHYIGTFYKDQRDDWYRIRQEINFNHIINYTSDLVEKGFCERSLQFFKSQGLKINSHTCNEVTSFSPGVDGIIFDRDNLFGIDYLGERGKRLESILNERIKYINECISERTIVDVFLADQILLPLSIYANLFDKEVCFACSQVTTHFTTNIHLISRVFSFANIRYQKQSKLITIAPNHHI